MTCTSSLGGWRTTLAVLAILLSMTAPSPAWQQTTPVIPDPALIPDESEADPASLKSPSIPSSRKPRPIAGEPASEFGADPASSADNPPRKLSRAAHTTPVAPDAPAEVEQPRDARPVTEPRPRVSAEAATLKGIQPGRSNRNDLEKLWGLPKEIKKVSGAVQQSYVLDPFKRVTVMLIDEVVSSVVIHLDEPLAADSLALQLRITTIEPVTVLDAKGKPLGQAYPERGILFGYADDADPSLVSQVVLEPIDSLPFLLRAEHNLRDRYSHSLADADFALGIDPKNGHAHWVRAEALSAAGDFQTAREAAKRAAELDPAVSEHSLTLGKVLAQLTDYDAATREFQRVIATLEASDIAKARAYCQLGDCLVSSRQDYKQAMQHHLQAIKLAEPLAADDRPKLRRAAKEILLDAHLSVAHDIAWGNWQQQDTAVPKWLKRAGELAEDLIANDGGSVELRLRVSEQALAAFAGVPEPPSALEWIKPAIEIAKELIAKTDDTARQEHLSWQLGVALYDGMQICKARSDATQALLYGEMAIEHLERGQQAGGQLAARDFLMGRLFFSLGTIHAIDREDHKQAVVYFDKATPLLEKQPAGSAFAEAGQQGEAFVSMAVSYWDLGGREQAMKLTRQGVKLMEQAVKRGTLSKSALGVAYSNLASMHQDLGDEKQARQFTEMAAKYEEPAK